MLVRKIKCPTCGANKVNDLKTSYIYCDYCGTLMGYDMEMLQDESKEIFSVKNLVKPLQRKYISLSQDLNNAIQSKDKDRYIDIQMQIYETEFKLYKKRFSPKIKQPSYRKKYLNYYKKFWSEKIDNGYFEKAQQAQKDFQVLGSKISTRIEGTKTITEFDDNFITYLNAIKDYVKKSVNEAVKMDCMEYYPEGRTSISADILYKQSISSFIQQFDEDTIKKSLKHLGMKNEFIEVDDVEISETNCIVCNALLKIPKGSKSVICENCGSLNELKSKKIRCFGCGAYFDPNENDACPYCGAKVISVKKEKVKEKHKPNKKSGGFSFIEFIKSLFGR